MADAELNELIARAMGHHASLLMTSAGRTAISSVSPSSTPSTHPQTRRPRSIMLQQVQDQRNTTSGLTNYRRRCLSSNQGASLVNDEQETQLTTSSSRLNRNTHLPRMPNEADLSISNNSNATSHNNSHHNSQHDNNSIVNELQDSNRFNWALLLESNSGNTSESETELLSEQQQLINQSSGTENNRSIEVEEESDEPHCGWELELFLSTPDDLLLCPVCSMVIRDAVQCPRQHCFCKVCLETALSHKSVCPMCRTDMTWDEIEPNRMVRAMVERLSVRCPNHERGCTVVQQISEIVSHVNSCDFAIITCTNTSCTDRILRKDLKQHLSMCQFTTTICDVCGDKFFISERASHSCLQFVLQQVRQLTMEIKQRDKTMTLLQERNTQLEARIQALEMGMHCSSSQDGITSPMFSESGRPAPGDIVILSHDFESYADASDGPLDVGLAGWVLADDMSDDLPIRVNVHTRGEWWYAASALRVIAKPGDLVTRRSAMKGLPIARGPHWKWGLQDGGRGCVGFITRCKGDWCDCSWPRGERENAYRIGPHKFDLVVANMTTHPDANVT